MSNLVVKAAFPVQDSNLADNDDAFARVEACVKEVLRATAGLEVISADGARRVTVVYAAAVRTSGSPFGPFGLQEDASASA